ncbi:MAG TPA: ferritin family protein [Smithellaceae bacterium]|jgi:rubrerythrin|nr:ferritin family protein [Smithellaceae bacterium]HPV49080.1 ferritin family protein [Smithellaceae bacterium]HQF85332.1 ferritin family protein [Smithellaceae bacterium]HQG81554.1 ferritin family protein [Smithellaceae bacterium]
MQVFTANDIVEVAVRIEENGITFYNFAEQMAKTADVKKLFADLAAAEAAHKRIFEKLLSQIETFSPPERYVGEYAEYLRNYVDNNIIFTKEVMDKQLAAVTDTLGAIEFAMQRELDSILYYHEIKNLVPQAQHETIEKIIEEERKHYAMLLAVKKQYA